MDLKSVFSNENMKKIVLVDKSSNIYHARRYLVEKYGVLLNTYVLTLDQYAMDLTGEIRYANNLEIIGREESLYLIEAIMNSSDEPFEYFREDIISLNTYTEVLSTIIELKKTGINWDDTGFKGRIRTEELSRIYLEYEDALKNSCLIDEADLLKIPVEAAKDSIHFVFDNVSWLPLEKGFFENSCSKKFTILPLPKPDNLPRPDGYTYQSLDDFENSDTKNIRIIRAYGLTNEVQGVFRDILLRGIPLDSCMILYTGGEYVDYIRNAADYFGVRATIQEGFKLDDTAPYYLISQLIWYVTNGFLTSSLKPLFDSNVMDLKISDEAGNTVSNSTLLEFINRLRVSTGAERLQKRLINYISDCKDRLNELEKKDGHTYSALKRTILIGEGLMPFLTDIAELENLDGDTDKWLSTLRIMMIKYTSISPEEITKEGENFKALEAISEVMMNYIDGPCSYSSVSVKWLYELEQRVKGARKDMHTPFPGRLHAARYTNVMLVSRPNVYVIGLDAGHFPDIRGESSILNDFDRRKISPQLGLEPRKSDAAYRLLEALGNAEGEISLIYSYYDTVKVNENNPSSFVQMMMSRPGIIYDEFTFVSTNMDKVLAPMDGLIFEPSKYLGQTEKAEFCTTEPEPGFLENNVFSASQVEMMVRCGKMYYYRYILGIPEEREEVLGHYGWLDASDRGTLLHSILDGVVKAVNGNEETEVVELVQKVCEREFKALDRQIPCTIKQHYDSLYERYLEAVLRYAVRYAELKSKGEIRESITEMKFAEQVQIKANFEMEDGISEERSIVITLRGFIDRVDILSDGTITIVDYKSGKPFEDSSANVERLQDYLYSLAAESIFRDRMDITGISEARYDFPLEPADGVSWRMDPAKRSELINEKARITYKVLTDAANGYYYRSPDGKPCTYCSYALHCRPHINGGEE